MSSTHSEVQLRDAWGRPYPKMWRISLPDVESTPIALCLGFQDWHHNLQTGLAMSWIPCHIVHPFHIVYIQSYMCLQSLPMKLCFPIYCFELSSTFCNLGAPLQLSELVHCSPVAPLKCLALLRKTCSLPCALHADLLCWAMCIIFYFTAYFCWICLFTVNMPASSQITKGIYKG